MQLSRMLVFLLSILFSLYALIAFSQATDESLIGKSVSQISSKAKLNSIDNRIKVFYLSNQIDIIDRRYTMTNYVAFDDIIVFIQVWNDQTIEGLPSSKLDEQIDQQGIDSLQMYFNMTYNLNLNIKDGVSGIIPLKEIFGIACGAAGASRDAGKRYLELLDANLSKRNKIELLTSINPMHQLFGYLLLSKSNAEVDISYVNRIKHNQFKLQFCNGCDGTSSKTIEEIIKNMSY